MEINVLEDKKNRMVFELKGAGHTLCNALRQELWNDDKVTVSAYNISHPIVGIPKFIVETAGKKKAKNAVKSAITRLKRQNTALQNQAKKLKK